MKMVKAKGRKHYTVMSICQSRVVICGKDQYCEDVDKTTENVEQVNCRECLKMLAEIGTIDEDKDFLDYYNQESKERVTRIKAGEETESDRGSMFPLSFDVKKMLKIMVLMKSM